MTASGITTAAGAAPPDSQRLLGEQTAPSLLRNTMHVLCSHFWVLQACGVLPVLPILVVHEMMAAEEHPLVIVTALAYMVALFLSSGALTVAVSDICLGNRPTVRRSFARVLSHRRWWHVLSTSLVLFLGITLGLILLVLPGLWLTARGLFTSVIVVLEARQNTGAIRRSLELTKGQAWRVTGLALLPILLAYIALVLLVLAVMLVAWLLDPASPPDPESMGMPVTIALNAIGFGLTAPVIGIAMVLLYYDQRVRREAYDARALSEDLMR